MFSNPILLKVKSQRALYNFFRKCGHFNGIPLNYEFIIDPKNTVQVEKAILEKDSKADLNIIKKLYIKLKTEKLTKAEESDVLTKLEKNALEVPNIYDPKLIHNVPQVLETINEKPQFKFKTKDFPILLKYLRMIYEDQVFAWFTGRATYCLYNDAAVFEKAIIRYTLSTLNQKGFTLLSVPDILYENYIEKAGMLTRSKRSQVYHLDNDGKLCLAGTSEHSICSYLADKVFDVKELPLKFMALSRCYREEAKSGAKEKGLFRLNQFDKVEMFGVTSNETGEESQQLYNEFITIQKELYSPLGVHLQILNIPPNDLGSSAYCKTDIEAWLAYRQYFGEISSASNCTDYQSRRLNIRYRDANGNVKFAHTVNGTGCALPRLMMAVFLTHQKEDRVNIPEIIRPFMGNKEALLMNTKKMSFKMARQ